MTGPKEVAELAGVDVVVDLEKEMLVKLKGAGELLHELPDALHELREDGGHFFGVTVQMATPAEMQTQQG